MLRAHHPQQLNTLASKTFYHDASFVAAGRPEKSTNRRNLIYDQTNVCNAPLNGRPHPSRVCLVDEKRYLAFYVEQIQMQSSKTMKKTSKSYSPISVNQNCSSE